MPGTGGWFDEYEFFGLAASDLKSRYGQNKTSVLGGVTTDCRHFSWGDGQVGTTSDFEYDQQGKIVKVRKSWGGCTASSHGPWLETRTAAVWRAELEYTELLAQGSSAPLYLAMLRKRASIRHELHQDEFAVRDLYDVVSAQQKQNADEHPSPR